MKTCVPTVKILLLLLLTTSLASCVGYHFNGTTPHHISTVKLAPIINQTDEPAIERQVTRAMRSFIQFDGRLKLVDHDQADAKIEITLKAYQNNPIAYRAEDREVAPRFYRQSITATARLINLSTGQLLQEATNHGEALFEFESDLSTSKRNTQAEAANELARLLFSDLIETWQ
ncbi:MAG: hypothetical protein CMF27_06895 [Kiritimatiellaceae bacterium]|mgnify:FL=1|jgi:hypothetical protein|nr:hypothetical protein [Kiritimatiellaceae bacterium]